MNLLRPLLVASACAGAALSCNDAKSAPVENASGNASVGGTGSGGSPAGGTPTAGSAPSTAGSTAIGGEAPSGAAGANGTRTQVSYETDAESVLANPERGFYHHLETRSASYSALTAAELQGFRTNESVSLVLRVFYLESFMDAELTADYLAKLTGDFAAARDAGSKLVLRFAYTSSESGEDATRERILGHLQQLAPVLAENVDVIATVQAGLIGAWGEWYYTQHFGNAGSVSQSDYDNRKAVVDALLQALPKTRAVQLRTPAFKRRLYGTTPLDAASAFSGTPASRIGHHNDAFVADATDMGTYLEPEVELPYLEADSAWLPVGGENNQYLAPRTACPSALAEMEKLHVSFLNTDYLAATITEWKEQGCYETMRRRLGYRLSLTSGSFDEAAPSGGSVLVSLTLKNEGFAAPFNPRAVELVLRSASGEIHRLPLDAEPRSWLPGKAIELERRVSLSGVPAGRYALFLALPDPTPSLRDRAEYAVRLANSDVWEASLAANRLGAELQVLPAE